MKRVQSRPDASECWFESDDAIERSGDANTASSIRADCDRHETCCHVGCTATRAATCVATRDTRRESEEECMHVLEAAVSTNDCVLIEQHLKQSNESELTDQCSDRGCADCEALPSARSNQLCQYLTQELRRINPQ